MDDFDMERQFLYENTYITGPDGYGEGTKFSSGIVRNVVRKIIEDRMEGAVYDSTRASQIIKELSDMIKEKVKTMGYNRYKLVVQISSRDRETPAYVLLRGHEGTLALLLNSCASAYFENETLFLSASVYGLYYE
eukprot:gene20001-23935_t